jgi:tRNA pseudouridine55 synthase
MNGILLFHKPIGWTSHDAVGFVRRRLSVRRPADGPAKVGHAGTLDPMATGLLLILVGEATRHSGSLTGLDKDYRGLFELGVTTDTQDFEGRVIERRACEAVTADALRAAMEEVASRKTQTPPQFSAVKRGGRKLYESARKGVAVEVEPRPAEVLEMKLERYQAPEAEFFIRVAKGFYVRTFCHDVGQTLGCGAALSCLVRTRIGPHRLEEAVGPGQWDNIENLQRFFRPTP